MRDFLFSEIAAIHGLPNIPDDPDPDPDLAIAAGTRLCEELLEPLQDAFGRIAVRGSYRSSEVNALGNRLMRDGKPAYTKSLGVCLTAGDSQSGHDLIQHRMLWEVCDGIGGYASG